ncbi:hypothetical protein KQY30_11325 [Streptomyces sp. GMY02]|uniref:hypothetical protein n=1 Tax=Streptomyces sp. GMY02 TaxID=1333528 RepID=UPI001C2B7E21|nr:hypothetical protein [Streptomyces sp. GMY02]QXE34782.1 hypothetical protein KQY30_11325 [Streptomyces sp. GMY02]
MNVWKETGGACAADGHLTVDLDGGTADVWRQCADVLYASRERTSAEAEALAARTLLRYPGCLLTLVRYEGGGCWAAVRAADRTVTLPVPDASPRQCCACVASLLYPAVVRALSRHHARQGPATEPPDEPRRPC